MWFKRKKISNTLPSVKREEEEDEEKILHTYNKPLYNNWKGNKYAERLIAEWLKYGKICLAIDFDDTLYPWGFKGFEANLMFKKAMDIIKLAQDTGCFTTIWSACAPDRYDYIRDYCKSYDIPVDTINENPIPLPYGNNRKMYYNHLLDDRAGLEQALDVLEYACYRVRTDRKPADTNFET